jgi:hypothetical protein
MLRYSQALIPLSEGQFRSSQDRGTLSLNLLDVLVEVLYYEQG